jgi:hypothetical protein
MAIGMKLEIALSHERDLDECRGIAMRTASTFAALKRSYINVGTWPEDGVAP